MTNPVVAEQRAGPRSTIRWDVVATVLVVLLAGFHGGKLALTENLHVDLWIYSSGSWLGFHGLSPYNTERIHDRVAQQYPGDAWLIENSGFFLAPQAMLVFAPFAMLPWVLAKALWCALTIGMTVVAIWQLRRFTITPPSVQFTAVALFVVMLNPVTLVVLNMGQTPLLILSLVFLGQWAHSSSWERLGGFLWALAFFKPHIALPLLVVAWFLSGWRRAAIIAGWGVLLNLLAGVVTVGNPFLLMEFLDNLRQGHQSVLFNQLLLNSQLTSWNQLVRSSGGPRIELGAMGVLAGYAVWFLLAVLRVRLRGERSTASWVLAMAACGMLVCCQLLAYELPLLLLLLPYIADLLASDGRRSRLTVALLVGLTAYTLMGQGPAEPIALALGGAFDQVVASLGMSLSFTNMMLSHRALGVCSIACVVLLQGSPRVSPLTNHAVATTHGSSSPPPDRLEPATSRS